MFLHTLKNTFRIILRKKNALFWTLVFPIILACLFKLAFGNIYESNQFKNIPIGVNENLYEDQEYKKFLEKLEEDKYFIIKKVKDKKVLEDEKIVAYIEGPDTIITKDSGINETIVENIFNTYLRKKEVINRTLKKDQKSDIEGILQTKNYVKDISKKNMNFINVYFYTLIGMQLIYGYTWGMKSVEYQQANLSSIGKRNSISPTDKKTQVFTSLLVGWAFNFFISLFSIFVFWKFLGVEFGERIGFLVLLVGIGSLTGVSFGSLVESASKSKQKVKEALCLGLTMLFSFFAGMMVLEIKVIIEEKIPFLNKINPVALITDGIYALYYYDGLSRYYHNIIYLGLLSVVFIFLTFLFTRGKQYENL